MAKKDNYDYQLDLTPFISLLSVCICFLLVTVAWYQVGSLTMKQVMGGDTSEVSKENKPSLWIHLESKKDILVKIKKGKKYISQKVIRNSKTANTKKIANTKNTEKEFNHNDFKKYVLAMKKQIPDLNQAIILPNQDILYEDIIKIMDGVRQSGVFNLGVSPI